MASLGCRTTYLLGPVTRDATHVAFAWAGETSGIIEWTPGAAARITEFADLSLLNGAFISLADGGYRLVGADARSARIASRAVAADGTPAPAEFIEIADARAVRGAVETSDRRTLTLLSNGGSALRVLERTANGSWTHRSISEHRVGEPALAATAAGEPLIAWTEAMTTRPFGALHVLRGTIDTVNNAWRAGAVTALSAAPDSDELLAQYGDSEGHALLGVFDARARVTRSITIPNRYANPRQCASLARVVDTSPGESTCHIDAIHDDPPVVARGSSNVAWIVSVEHHFDIDQHVDVHCHPVDPPGGARHWHPSPSCERSFRPIANRSTADLVVRAIDPHTLRVAARERARVRLPFVANTYSSGSTAIVARGVVHVMVTAPTYNDAHAVYVALDEATLAQ